MDKKGTLSFKAILILLIVFPMTLALVILSVICTQVSKANLENNIREELKVSAYSLREYYIYDLENGINLDNGFCEYDTEYIDRMCETGVDFTLFQEDVRFMTTIRSDVGLT